MKRLLLLGFVTALVLAAAPAAMGVLQGLSRGTGEAASPALACSVRSTACLGGEVAVFRMSGLANAHAQTTGFSSYPYVVCCSGPAGLSNACSGSYDTVLTLSAADNAHVASSGYGTQVCLSADAGVDCQYGPSCSTGYACLATISDTTNAHVADCDGSGDYGTRVCCSGESGPVCTPPFTPIVAGDSDCDAAPDAAELGPDPVLCGARDPNNPWDFYDVPVPTLHVGGSMYDRNGAVTLIDDVLGVLEYSGTIDDGPPTTAGRDYDDDNDGDGIDDGIAYDRGVGAPWPELGEGKSHSGPPDGAVTLYVDVLLVLDQSGHGPCPP